MIARAVKRIDRWRYLCQIESIDTDEGGLEMDSHADTCTGGPEMILLDGTVLKRVEVLGFLEQFGSIKDIPVGTCVTAYEVPGTGEVIFTTKNPGT